MGYAFPFDITPAGFAQVAASKLRKKDMRISAAVLLFFACQAGAATAQGPPRLTLRAAFDLPDQRNLDLANSLLDPVPELSLPEL